MPRTFEFNDIPVGYHITFRGHGTWLHGDKRGSVDRFHNSYGTPRIPHNERWRKYNRSNLKLPPVKLDKDRRVVVEQSIRETCKIPKWDFWTTNVRSNHVHTVVSASCKAERVRSALKANATRKLREAGCWPSPRTPWAERGSIKYLWTEKDLNEAIAYVEYDQGEPLP